MPDKNSPPPLEFQVFDPERQELRVMVIHPPKRRYWVHILLFLATVFTTLCIGAKLQYNFEHQPGRFAGDDGFWPWKWVLEDWHRLYLGIPFSACLLGILTAHEFGHYVYAFAEACTRLCRTLFLLLLWWEQWEPLSASVRRSVPGLICSTSELPGRSPDS